MHDAHKAQLEMERALQIHEPKELTEEAHRLSNEMVAKVLERDAEPLPEAKIRELGMYYEPAEGTGGLPAIICTCGQAKRHLRMKVLQRWADKHYQKTGHMPLEKE